MEALHEEVKQLTDRKTEVKTSNGYVKDKNGQMLFEQIQIGERWAE